MWYGPQTKTDPMEHSDRLGRTAIVRDTAHIGVDIWLRLVELLRYRFTLFVIGMRHKRLQLVHERKITLLGGLVGQCDVPLAHNILGVYLQHCVCHGS